MGKITVVGLGPGAGEDLTSRARRAIEEADLVVGYTAYIDLIRDQFPDKEMVSTGMRKEVDRCRMAAVAAAEGRRVAMVCSGDAGVYGMAALVYEVAGEFPPVEIQVVPGITAACGGAAVLGAPLTHDFVVISLSDLLTPWEKIARRLALAAEADFVICLYNPRSRSREDHLRRACDILLEHKAADTVCGFVQNIGRPGERGVLLPLRELRDNTEVDMFTTVFIGNSQTVVLNGRMVTPRGYLQREG
jgi:precorrin-3B C17-methyltransferase